MANFNGESHAGSTLPTDVSHHLDGSEVTEAGKMPSEEASNPLINDPMELDSDPKPVVRRHTENISVFDAATKGPDHSAIVVTHPGPRRPAKLPLEVVPDDEKSHHKGLKDRLEDALDDKRLIKKNLAEAEERIAEALRRAETAETQLAAVRAQILTKRSPERDHELARYRDNEKIYQNNERIYKEIETKYKAIQKQLQQSQASVEALKKKEAQDQEGMVHWKKETQIWTNKANQYEADLKQIQEKSLREMTDSRWNPIPDKDLKDRLHVLYLDVRDWAKTWAASSIKLDSMPQESRKDFLQSFLSDFVRLDSSGGLPAEIASPSTKMKDKIPWLLLSSALSDEIEDKFFRNPFFCVDTKHMDALRDMYEVLIKASPREAHIWRSMMWRLLNPPAAGRSPKEQAIFQETQHRVQVYCDRLDADFKKGPAKLLLRTGESDGDKRERAKALREILTKAAGIATSLWVQRSYLTCVGLDTFKSRKQTFDIQSAVLKSHALNKVDVDDPSNNGRKILLVVRPALLALDIDDAKGLNGEEPRILAEAIVYLEDKPSSAMRYLGL